MRFNLKKVIAKATSSPTNLVAALVLAFMAAAILATMATWLGKRRDKLTSNCKAKCATCTRCQRKGKPCKIKCRACTQCRGDGVDNKKPKKGSSGRKLLSQDGDNSGGGGWRSANLTVYGGNENPVPVAMAPYKWDPSEDIAAVHSRDFNEFQGKRLAIKVGKDKQFTVRIVDMCADKDCGSNDRNCCTRNANKFGSGFLIDLHKRTAGRHNIGSTVTPAQFRVL